MKWTKKIRNYLTHNLISGFAAVHQVCEQDGVFRAREAACSYFTGAFLDGDSLVVLVHSLHKEEKESTH